MISYQKCQQLSQTAEITYNNMLPYYKHYAVDWDKNKIEKQIANLQNWDILYGGEIIGAFRLDFESSHCYLRDLQIKSKFQNKGIGAKALEECQRLALQQDMRNIRLKVFKISPAYNLYVREGFIVCKEDERFYYMEKAL